MTSSEPDAQAADIVRLVGIGRNEYIATMNKCKAKKLLWRVNRAIVKDLLPTEQLDTEKQDWWTAHVVNIGDCGLRVSGSPWCFCTIREQMAVSFPPTQASALAVPSCVRCLPLMDRPASSLTMPALSDTAVPTVARFTAQADGPCASLLQEH